jgi:hypothetical protein
VNPLRRENLASNGDIQRIFSNVEMLLGVNRLLLKDIEDAALENSEEIISTIGQCFVNLVRKILLPNDLIVFISPKNH